MGELKKKLREDLVAATKAREQMTMDTLRMGIAAIANEEVAGKQARELSEAEEQAVITREVRKRKESAEIYESANRPELAAKEQAEIEILSKYIPAPLTDAELDQIVAEEVANAGDPDMKKMGMVIKAVNARAAGRVDGSAVAAKVKAALSA